MLDIFHSGLITAIEAADLVFDHFCIQRIAMDPIKH